MNIDTFLNMAEHMVIEYYNRYINDGEKRPVTQDDLSYALLTDNSKIFEVSIVVRGDQSVKYTVYHCRKTNTTKSYLYKEIKNMISRV